jgi:hypothetical protein
MHVLRSRVLRITAISNKIRRPVKFVITEFDGIYINWMGIKRAHKTYMLQNEVMIRNYDQHPTLVYIQQ